MTTRSAAWSNRQSDKLDMLMNFPPSDVAPAVKATKPAFLLTAAVAAGSRDQRTWAQLIGGLASTGNFLQLAATTTCAGLVFGTWAAMGAHGIAPHLPAAPAGPFLAGFGIAALMGGIAAATTVVARFIGNRQREQGIGQ